MSWPLMGYIASCYFKLNGHIETVGVFLPCRYKTHETNGKEDLTESNKKEVHGKETNEAMVSKAKV